MQHRFLMCDQSINYSKNRYFSLILEKLVDALKMPDAVKCYLRLFHDLCATLCQFLVQDILHAQIFQCLRVLLTRVDVSNLSTVWPLIITETIRYACSIFLSFTFKPSYL